MNKKDFMDELLEIMEREDEIFEDMKLEDIEEWDSLARITFTAFLDADFGINVASEDIKAAKTISDLLKFVEAKIGD